MRNFFKIILVLISASLLYYLLLPNRDFPAPPPNSVQSNEPADSESPLIRRAYFTDYSRSEVIDWYKNQMGWGYILNYPPEDAQTIIRDQTRSTFLEEIVHTFRESVYVNGFEPKDDKDTIIIDGRHFRQKITVKYVQSTVWVRIAVFAGTILLSIILFKGWKKSI
ncbi:MAG TPA: hypothetical protein VKC54_00555 [Patescibacteria group bacterium]|nr:hypothetical protein [Patescibacteria group bacterium]